MKASIIDDLATCWNEIRDCLNRLLDENYAGEAPVIEDFKSGEDFLSRFLPEAYDIIFIDQYMDGLSGIGIAKRIRSAGLSAWKKQGFSAVNPLVRPKWSLCGNTYGKARRLPILPPFWRVFQINNAALPAVSNLL